jgi:choloylglycine hydrolase
MNIGQEQPASEPVRRGHSPTHVHAFTITVPASLALLVALWGLLAWHKPPGIGQPIADPTCTSFCLENSGHAVFGTNFDNNVWEGLLFVNQRGVTKNGWEAGSTGKVARWTAEYGSVTFNLAGAQSAWGGMNEAGLVISTMGLEETCNPTADERPPLVSPLWVQYQLDTCATLREVIANDTRVRIAGTVDHYLVCDRSGECAVVEFLGEETFFHTKDAVPVKTLANEIYRDAVAAWQSGEVWLSPPERFPVAADRVVSFQWADAPTAVAYAFDTLDQASGQATGGTPTQWSIVFDTENMRVHWRTSRNPEIRSIDFAKIEFACPRSVQMLDVHTPLAGDISGSLGSYSFEAKLGQRLTFLEKWGGMAVSPLEDEVLERGLASFPYERPAAPYQEERRPLVSPVVGWASLTVLHRFWWLGGLAALGIATVAAARVRGRDRRRELRRESNGSSESAGASPQRFRLPQVLRAGAAGTAPSGDRPRAMQ